MLLQDILITTQGADEYTIFPITTRGQSMVAAVVVGDIADHLMISASEKITNSVIARARKHDFDVVVVDWPEESTEANAVYMRSKAQMRAAEKMVADIFQPLLDAAFEERDKHRITDLFHQIPDAMARSFIIDRIRQTFPEFREPGMTIDNWTK